MLSKLQALISYQSLTVRASTASSPPDLESREHPSYQCPAGSLGWKWFLLESGWRWPGPSGLEGPLPGVWRSSFQVYHPPPVNRSTVEWFLRPGKVPATRCQCQPHSTTVVPNEAKVRVTLCQPDTTNVLYNDEGLLGTQIHSPSQMPTFSSWRDILHELSARAELMYLIKSQQSL